MFRKSTFPLLFILTALCCNAQVKNEREYRIKIGDFPEKAIQELKGYMKNARRIRYFQEVNHKNVSFEIKLNLEGFKHSIEFDSLGNLEDVETVIKKHEMPSAPLKGVEQSFDSEFTRYRIVKIQRQYPKEAFNSNEEVFNKAFQNHESPEVNYEIVVAGRKKEGFKDYEMTFNSNGELLNIREFISLAYDHILY